jgi:hypothetical protein
MAQLLPFAKCGLRWDMYHCRTVLMYSTAAGQHSRQAGKQPQKLAKGGADCQRSERCVGQLGTFNLV